MRLARPRARKQTRRTLLVASGSHTQSRPNVTGDQRKVSLVPNPACVSLLIRIRLHACKSLWRFGSRAARNSVRRSRRKKAVVPFQRPSLLQNLTARSTQARLVVLESQE
jgi:hypothetical protein